MKKSKPQVWIVLEHMRTWVRSYELCIAMSAMVLHSLAEASSLHANDPKPHTVGQGQPIDIP